MLMHPNINVPLPWSGVQLARMVKPQERAQRLVAEFTPINRGGAPLLAQKIPLLYSHRDDISLEQRIVINVLSRAECLSPEQRLLFADAMANAEIGKQLCGDLWNVLRQSTAVPFSSWASQGRPMQVFLGHFFLPILPESRGTGDVPKAMSEETRHLLAEGKRYNGAMNFVQELRHLFYQRDNLIASGSNMLWAALESLSPHEVDDDAIHDFIGYLNSANETRKFLITHGDRLTRESVLRFRDLVQEYNPEWAFAAMEW